MSDGIYVSGVVVVMVIAMIAGAVGFFGGRVTAAQPDALTAADVRDAVDVGLAHAAAAEAAAAEGKADLRSIIPSVEAYFAANYTYAGMTVDALHTTYDPALDTSKYQLASATGSTYCIQATSGTKTYFKAGPTAPIAEGSCPSP